MGQERMGLPEEGESSMLLLQCRDFGQIKQERRGWEGEGSLHCGKHW